MRWLAAATAGLILAFGTTARSAEISISCSALGKEYEICKEGVDAWAKKTGNTVKIVSTGNSATERLRSLPAVARCRCQRRRRVPD